MRPDTLMALRSHDGPATKTHKRLRGEWVTESYGAGLRFDAAETPALDGIGDLSDVLTRLEDEPRWLVIRGQLKSGESRQEGVLRRIHDRDDQPAHFEACDRLWVCLDVDSAPAPEGGCTSPDRGGLEALVKWTCKTYLPDAFQGVDTHYQWSSSAGVKPWSKLSLHLWFWLDRPACDKSLRAYFKKIPHIDARLFHPVQIHYTANPIFKGADDPIDRERSGLLRLGEDRAVLPAAIVDSEKWAELEAKEERARKKERERARRSIRAKSPAKVESKRIRYARRALESACDEILSAPKGARHDTLFLEAAAVAELVAAGYLDRHEATSNIEQAARASYSDPKRAKDVPRIIDDAFEKGMANPRDLSHVGEVSRKKRRIDAFPCFASEISKWPPMVRRRWKRRVRYWLPQAVGEPHPMTFAQMMATSELRGDGGTLPPYMLDAADRHDFKCAHCAGEDMSA